MSDFASWKELAREAAHDTFAVPATYQDAVREAASLPPVDLMVRWHGRSYILDPTGAGAGYASTLDTSERILFGRAELAAKSVDPVRGGTVTLPGYVTRSGPITFFLDNREPYDGPTSLIWNVARDVP